jgi:hypothetical protein
LGYRNKTIHIPENKNGGEIFEFSILKEFRRFQR